MQKYSTPAIVPGGGKDALAIETLPDALFGSVDVYLASDVDARIAELEKALQSILELEHGATSATTADAAFDRCVEIARNALMVRGSHA